MNPKGVLQLVAEDDDEPTRPHPISNFRMTEAEEDTQPCLYLHAIGREEALTDGAEAWKTIAVSRETRLRKVTKDLRETQLELDTAYTTIHRLQMELRDVRICNVSLAARITHLGQLQEHTVGRYSHITGESSES